MTAIIRRSAPRAVPSFKEEASQSLLAEEQSIMKHLLGKELCRMALMLAQSIKRWSTDSHSVKHKMQRSSPVHPLLRRLSAVRTLPRRTSQTKILTFKEALIPFMYYLHPKRPAMETWPRSSLCIFRERERERERGGSPMVPHQIWMEL